MVFRDMVINGLKVLRTWCAVNPKRGIGLSVYECNKAVGWLDDTFVLLKEQEPVNPVHTINDAWLCGNCKDAEVGRTEFDACRIERIRYEFCPKCGRAVKWGADD